MATTEGAALARNLRAVLDAGPARDRGDAELLDRFAAGPGDAAQAAFASLVERHGPMVLRATQGILGRRHDAEDAFQATFLVLARQAPYLRDRASVGPWLYGVARRTALAARRLRARRAEVERSTPPGQPRDEPDAEAARVVHEEVARLADRDRAVVVLCDLEGESLDHAAQALGCPVGTVKSRLARARGRLRLRLERRGLGSPTALAALGAEALAPLDPALSGPVLAAASRFAAAPDLATEVAAHLARGVIRTMTWNRWMTSAATTLGATLAFAAGSTWLQAAPPVQDPPPRPPAGAPANPGPAIETAVAEPRFNTQVCTESAEILPPLGVLIQVHFPVRTRILSVAEHRKPVKVGDIIAELDPAPIQVAVTSVKEKIDLQKKNISAIEDELNRLAEAEKTLPRSSDPSTPATNPNTGQVTPSEQFARAKSRADRYRDASSKADRLPINESDPVMLPAIVARLELRDRLDQAEADLQQLLAREGRESSTGTSQLKIRTQREETYLRLSGSRAALAQNEERLKTHEDALTRCSIRSTADGLMDYPRFGSTPESDPTGPNGRNTPTGFFHFRIATAEKPDQIVAIRPAGATQIRHLRPGDGILVRSPARTDGEFRIRQTFPATFDKMAKVGKAGEIRQDVILASGKVEKSYDRLQPTPLFLTATPIQRAVGGVTIEFPAKLPTNEVSVPARAVTADERVAVRGPDGLFQWRNVQIRPDPTPQPGGIETVTVLKLLGEGEVVALDPYAAMGEAPPPQRKPSTPEPEKPAKP